MQSKRRLTAQNIMNISQDASNNHSNKENSKKINQNNIESKSKIKSKK